MSGQRSHRSPAPSRFARPRTWIKRAWIPLMWGVLCSAFYWEVLWAPADQIVNGDDLFAMFRIWLDYARSSILSGQFPLWNPYLYAGMSFVGDPQPALFYPPTWLALLVPASKALGLILVLHIWWAALGAFQWLRSELAQAGRTFAFWGAFAGASVFAFSGYMFARVQAGHLGVITTGAWLPWGLMALNSIAERGTWRRSVLGGVCVGMAILAGHTATFVYVALLWATYAGFLLWQIDAGRRVGVLLKTAAAGGLGLALAAVQLLPFLSSLLSTTRVGRADYGFSSRFSWPIGYLITLLIPNFFGEPVRTGYWGDGLYGEMIVYVGILPLLLGWVGWRARRQNADRRRIVFWAAVCGVALLIAFGSHSIVHRLLFRFLPGFSTLRAPARAGFLLTCGAAWLTGYGVTDLLGSEPSRRRRLLDPLRRTWVGKTLGGVLVLVVACYLVYGWGKDTNPEIGRFWHLAGQVAAFGLFFALSVGLLRLWAEGRPSRWLPVLASALILLDLWTLGAQLVTVVDDHRIAFWRIVARHTTETGGRVLPWGVQYLHQNGAMSFEVRSVSGYNPLESQTYQDFISANPDPRARAFDLLNATHVATTYPLDLSEDDTLTLTVEDSGVFLYERSTAMPGAWIAPATEVVPPSEVIRRVNDPGYDPAQVTLVEAPVDCTEGMTGTVAITDRTLNTVIAEVRGGGGLVVFSERTAPGWRAWVDGIGASIVRANGVLRAVCVPAGTHTVELRYRPPSLAIGAGITVLSLMAVGVGMMTPSLSETPANQGLG